MPRGACPFFVVGPGCSESVPVWAAGAAGGPPREEVEEQAMRGTRTYLVLSCPSAPPPSSWSPPTWQENRLYRTVGRPGWCRGALV